MKKIFYPISLFAFWIVLFNLFRILFFILHTSKSFEAVKGFFHSINIDIATASYLILPSLILWILSLNIHKNKLIFAIALTINIILVVVVCIIETASIPLYDEWGTTLNARALGYLLNDQDVWHVISDSFSLTIVLLLIIS